MDRLSEIRARCEGAKEEKRKGNALDCACLSWAVVLNDVPYLLAEVERLTARAEKAEAENRWIPVSEKLPEQDGSYLVIDESGNMFNSTFDGGCGDNGEFGEWSAIYDQHTLGYLDSEWNSYSGITHWRPLPEPPKGE